MLIAGMIFVCQHSMNDEDEKCIRKFAGILFRQIRFLYILF